MIFSEWLLNEEAGGVLFAKAVDKDGLDSILASGFRMQGRQSTASAEFSRGGGSTEEQMYGPGLYFYMVPSEQAARRQCSEYAGWGGHVVLASLKPSARILITSWLPESHPVWHHSPAGHAGVHAQFEALGVLDLFPDYGRGETHIEPEWGYRLAGRVDGWLHQHNTRTHLVVYNPSSVEVVGHFECERTPESPSSASSAKVHFNGPSKTNPKTGRPYDPSVPLDRQMKITGLLANTRDIELVRRIQSDKSHPDHDHWKDFAVDSPRG